MDSTRKTTSVNSPSRLKGNGGISIVEKLTGSPVTRPTQAKIYAPEAQLSHVIMSEDFTNFDGFIALMILLKSKNVKLELIIANYSFGNVGPSINNVYDILSMFGDETTPVVTGSYYAPEEVAAGANPAFNYDVGQQVPNQPSNKNLGITALPFNYPNPTSEPVGQIAQPMYNMFIPPLWKELGSTLYGTVNMIKRNTNRARTWTSVQETAAAPYVPAEEHIKNTLERLKANNQKAVIFNSGTHTDLSKFFVKYGTQYNAQISEVVIMGGGFFNFAGPTTAEKAEQRWAGNIFSSDIFGMSPLFSNPAFEPPPTFNPPAGYANRSDPTDSSRTFVKDWAVKPGYRSMQEFNVFGDPSSAHNVFQFLYNNDIKTTLVPTDATDPILIGDHFDSLKFSPTPEGQYVYALIDGIKKFNGSLFPYVIRAWDALAAIVFLRNEVVDVSQKGDVRVTQLGSIEALKRIALTDSAKNPFNVLNYNPYVGQTKLYEADGNRGINVVTALKGELAFTEIVNRLNATENCSWKAFNYYPLA